MTKDLTRLWMEGNAEDHQWLLSFIFERAWIHGEDLLALPIRPKYLIWVREGLRERKGEIIEPAQLPEFLRKENGC